MAMNNLYLQLFLTFSKIGAFTFGGGWAMISIIQREIVEKHKWIALDEFLDLLAVAQSMPGILAVNISVVIGDRLKGIKGSICAAIGTILPSFLMILAIAIFLTPDTIKNNEIVSRIFKGIRPAVGHQLEDGHHSRGSGPAHLQQTALHLQSHHLHRAGGHWRLHLLYAQPVAPGRKGG